MVSRPGFIHSHIAFHPGQPRRNCHSLAAQGHVVNEQISSALLLGHCTGGRHSQGAGLRTYRRFYCRLFKPAVCPELGQDEVRV
jgi:hypothetical protein